MRELTQDNVRAYIDCCNALILNKKIVGGYLFLCILFSVPTALFGIYAPVTTIIMLPILVAMTVWAGVCYFRRSDDPLAFTLYQGCVFTVTSLSSLLASYKFLSTIMVVPAIVLVSAFLVYLVGHLS